MTLRIRSLMIKWIRKILVVKTNLINEIPYRSLKIKSKELIVSARFKSTHMHTENGKLVPPCTQVIKIYDKNRILQQRHAFNFSKKPIGHIVHMRISSNQ